MESAVFKTGLWEPEEHEKYLAALNPFVSWEDVSRRVGTRSRLQCRTHHQKIEKKLRKAKEAGSRKSIAPRVEHRLPTEQEMLTLASHSKPSTSPERVLDPPISPFGVDETILYNMASVDAVVSPLFDTAISEVVEDSQFDFSVDEFLLGFEVSEDSETISQSA